VQKLALPRGSIRKSRMSNGLFGRTIILSSLRSKLSLHRTSDSTCESDPRISKLFPSVDNLTIEEAAELIGWFRNELEDSKLKDGTVKKGGLTLYMEALLAKVDQYLIDQNTRQLEIDGVVRYTFSSVPGAYQINGEALWPTLRHYKISRSRAYDFVPNKDKIAKLVEEGIIPLAAVEKHTDQKEGYMRHTIKLLRPPE
jgi:hypothetical protein